MTNLQVPDELSRCFEKLAHDSGRDKQDYMLDPLSSYLEDADDMRIVSERLAHPGRRITLEEVERNLGLED